MTHALLVRRKLRRVRRTREEIALLLEGYQSSGLTQRAYATRKGVSLSTLSNWLRRCRNTSDDGPEAPQRLVEVKIAGQPGTLTGSARGRFELGLAGGSRLWIPHDFDEGALRRLLGLLFDVGVC